MAFEMHVSQLISKSVYCLHSVYSDCRLSNHVSAKNQGRDIWYSSRTATEVISFIKKSKMIALVKSAWFKYVLSEAPTKKISLHFRIMQFPTRYTLQG